VPCFDCPLDLVGSFVRSTTYCFREHPRQAALSLPIHNKDGATSCFLHLSCLQFTDTYHLFNLDYLSNLLLVDPLTQGFSLAEILNCSAEVQGVPSSPIMGTIHCRSPDPYLVLGFPHGHLASVEEIERAFRVRERGHHLDELGIIEIEDVGAQVYLIEKSYLLLKKAALTGCEVGSLRDFDPSTMKDGLTVNNTESDTAVKMENTSPPKPNLAQYEEHKTTDGNVDADSTMTETPFRKKRNKSRSKRNWRSHRSGASRQGPRPAGWVGEFDSDVQSSPPPPVPQWNKRKRHGWNHRGRRRSSWARSDTWTNDKFN